MTKLNRFGWSSYPDGVLRPIEIMSYDGNKYCWVRFVEDKPNQPDLCWNDRGWLNQKIGYVSRNCHKDDYSDYKQVRRIDLWVIQGKDRRSFKPRQKKTKWIVYKRVVAESKTISVYCDTKAEAIQIAQANAKVSGLDVEIWSNISVTTNGGYSGSHGDPYLEVKPNGQVSQYSHSRKFEGQLLPKFRKGHGKITVHRCRWTARLPKPNLYRGGVNA